MNVLKSIGAVLAGMIVIVILSATTDFILEALGIFTPPDQGFFITWMVVVALIYRCLYNMVGAYVTAALAPRHPMRHVWALGIIGTVLGVLGIFIAWDLAPHWYPIALTVAALPTTWLGGRLKTGKN